MVVLLHSVHAVVQPGNFFVSDADFLFESSIFLRKLGEEILHRFQFLRDGVEPGELSGDGGQLRQDSLTIVLWLRRSHGALAVDVALQRNFTKGS